MKIGIVVPFSWSYWGGVVEHSENQAAALTARGHEVKLIMGNDPPGYLTRLLHPRSGRHGNLPPNIIPVGRSIVVPANGSLPNVVLSPQSISRIRRTLAAEQFDLIHVHEPMTPTISVAALACWDGPAVGTWHAAGDLGWMKAGRAMWGFVADRVDGRIAVSRMAAESVQRWLPGDYTVIPNGVVIPEHADPANRKHHVVFIGRHDQRKGLSVLLRAWPAIHQATGARLRLIGTDPLQYALLSARLGVDPAGIDVLGIVTNEVRSAELAAAKVFVSPALGGESFGLVLVESFATATPVVASDIPGFADVSVPEAAELVPPGDADALAVAVIALVEDEARRETMGKAARELAVERYSWEDVARRLEEMYLRVANLNREAQ